MPEFSSNPDEIIGQPLLTTCYSFRSVGSGLNKQNIRRKKSDQHKDFIFHNRETGMQCAYAYNM